MSSNKRNKKIFNIVQVVIYGIIISCLKINTSYSIFKIPDSWTRGNLSPNGLSQKDSINKFNKFSSNKNNQEEVILCLSKAYNVLLNGVCSYIINNKIQNKMKQSTPLYCIFNTQGIKIDKQVIPSISEMYLMRYYGISIDMLPRTINTSFNFNTNSEIKQNKLIKTNSGINYYSDILHKIKNNKLTKNDITQELLKQIRITDNKILSKFSNTYLINVLISQDDITKCHKSSEQLFQKCLNNNEKKVYYNIVKESCINYINNLNTVYKNKLSELTVQKKKLKTEVIKFIEN